jgi:hypothetical protein
MKTFNTWSRENIGLGSLPFTRGGKRVLRYTDYERKDYYRAGNLRRHVRFERLEMTARALGTLCYYSVKALGVVAQVAVCSLVQRNPYRLK